MGHSAPVKKTPQIDEHVDAQRRFVCAQTLARKYSITARYLLQLAADGRIPSLRLGRKCVRFSEEEVAKALEGAGK